MKVYLRINHTPDFDGGPPDCEYGVFSTPELAEAEQIHCSSCATVYEIEVDAGVRDRYQLTRL